ncbi:MAG TPA: poly-gamma-glutamate hydrolase family protein [Ilumatobacter sp.]|nr:poly-gamma-glutamate hydrolase family protein [Ilumatobacter sp.]
MVDAREFQRTGAPATLTELLALDGVREELIVAPGSRVGFMALHGGHLEAATDRIVLAAAAQAGASAYVVHHPEGLDRHLPSVRYRPDESAALSEFVEHVDVVVSLHGYGREGWWTTVLVGGADRALAHHLAAHLGPRLPGYDLVTDLEQIPTNLRGLSDANPVNATCGGGVQLELPPRVRGISPLSPPADADGWSPPTRALVDGLADFAHQLDHPDVARH